jgi:hypothetical protein
MKDLKVILMVGIISAIITVGAMTLAKPISSYSQAMYTLSTLGNVHSAEGILTYVSIDNVLSIEELHSLALLSNEYDFIYVTNAEAKETEMRLYECQKDVTQLLTGSVTKN